MEPACAGPLHNLAQPVAVQHPHLDAATHQLATGADGLRWYASREQRVNTGANVPFVLVAQLQLAKALARVRAAQEHVAICTLHPLHKRPAALTLGSLEEEVVLCTVVTKCLAPTGQVASELASLFQRRQRPRA